MATIIALTSDYLRKPVYINLDAVRSFAAKANNGGTVVHFIDGKELGVTESADEIYELAGRLEGLTRYERVTA
jgi:hypothetical protein